MNSMAGVPGGVTLDRRLAWSGRSTFDLDNPRQLATMYETVPREAVSVENLAQWIDGPTLVRLWAGLVLPPRLRGQWEARFAELTTARRLSA